MDNNGLAEGMVLRKRIISRKLQYLVARRGHGDGDNRWVAKGVVGPGLVQDYEEQLHGQYEKAEGSRSGRKRKSAPDSDEVVDSQSISFGKPSPLQISVILRNMFEFLPPEDLSSCRLVCRFWYEESFIAWRRTAPLKLSSRRGQITIPTDNQLRPFGDFLTFWEKECSTKPFHSFALSRWQFTSKKMMTILAGRSDIATFWSQVGRTMTTMKLDGCRFSCLQTFRQVIYKACPQLRNLELVGNQFDSVVALRDLLTSAEYSPPIFGEHRQLRSLTLRTDFKELPWGIPITLMELLSHFPCLTSITVFPQTEALMNDRSLRMLLNTIKTMRLQDRRNLPLTTFNISGYGNQSFDLGFSRLILTRELQLQLTELILQLGNNPRNKTAFAEDLELFQDAIGDIQAVQNFLPYPLSPFDSGILHVNQLQSGCVFCKSLEFLRCMPHLVRLSIRDYFTDEEDEFYYGRTDLIASSGGMAGVNLASLKELTFHYTISGEDLRKLAKWLPNVEKLDMPLDDHLFVLACQVWRGLKYVYARGRGLTDKGITGIGDKLESQTNFNFASLKALEHFRSDSGALTDASVFGGFLKTPNLRKIYLRFWDKIGGTAKGDLAAKGIVLQSKWTMTCKPFRYIITDV